jgi:hypothetical protein
MGRTGKTASKTPSQGRQGVVLPIPLLGFFPAASVWSRLVRVFFRRCANFVAGARTIFWVFREEFFPLAIGSGFLGKAVWSAVYCLARIAKNEWAGRQYHKKGGSGGPRLYEFLWRDDGIEVGGGRDAGGRGIGPVRVPVSSTFPSIDAGTPERRT